MPADDPGMAVQCLWTARDEERTSWRTSILIIVLSSLAGWGVFIFAVMHLARLVGY